MNKFKFSYLVLCLPLTACGWVDSTGLQEGDVASTKTVFVDPTLALLNNNGVLSVTENTVKSAIFTDDNQQLSNWTWTLLDGNADIDRCATLTGVQRDLISTSLSQSCLSEEACTVQVDEHTATNSTRFSITVPALRAPTVLAFQVTASKDDGSVIERNQTLCAMSINEAPNAQADHYTVLQGDTLHIKSDAANALLANDSDDDDILNSPLQVVTSLVKKPTYADHFELLSDGTFTYTPAPDAPLSEDGIASDRFEYAITDGTHTSYASAFISLVEFNHKPVQTASLPVIYFALDGLTERINSDLSSYFTDEDSTSLSFSVADGALPQSGNIQLTSQGLLHGSPSSDDAGDYQVTVYVSDGTSTIESQLMLSVVRFSTPNRAPTVSDISNKVVQNSFSYDVSTFFTDPDQDELVFSATNLPKNVSINTAGVISGVAANQVKGTWLITVTAEDGRGGQVSDRFRLSIR